VYKRRDMLKMKEKMNNGKNINYKTNDRETMKKDKRDREREREIKQ
jgi:hypothetical protein